MRSIPPNTYLEALCQRSVIGWVCLEPGLALDVIAQSILGSLATTAATRAVCVVCKRDVHNAPCKQNNHACMLPRTRCTTLYKNTSPLHDSQTVQSTKCCWRCWYEDLCDPQHCTLLLLAATTSMKLQCCTMLFEHTWGARRRAKTDHPGMLQVQTLLPRATSSWWYAWPCLAHPRQPLQRHG